jgi:L-lysine exporter family protein LysE/ArgO
MYSAFLEGFALSFGLIVAIGAQNAFVIRQGLLRSHLFLVCLICAVSDATLIFLGVYGFGSWLSTVENAKLMMTCFAALFIFIYGCLRVKSALNPEALNIDTTTTSTGSIALTTLAFTWLNPHVYLDTILLIGGASTRYLGTERDFFAVGAVFASFTFFFSLGYGARSLSTHLSQPRTWKFIDATIAVLMFVLCGILIGSIL